MNRLVLLCVLLSLLAIIGCGGGGLNKDELAKSVLASSKVYVAEGGEEAESALEGVAEELRNEALAQGSDEAKSAFEGAAEKINATPGPYEFHLGENACQDPQSATPAPKGEKALYQCFVHYGPVGANKAEEVELDFSIYSVNGECWNGVLVNLDSGLGTPEYYEVPTSQHEINSGEGVDLHGCIGHTPSRLAPAGASHPRKTSASSAALIAEPSKPPRIEPERVEISEGSQPLIVSHIHWQDWGARIVRGAGTLEVDNCTPSCAGSSYESQGPAHLYLAAPEGECGQVLYRRIKLLSSRLNGSYQLSCSGLAQSLAG